MDSRVGYGSVVYRLAAAIRLKNLRKEQTTNSKRIHCVVQNWDRPAHKPTAFYVMENTTVLEMKILFAERNWHRLKFNSLTHDKLMCVGLAADLSEWKDIPGHLTIKELIISGAAQLSTDEIGVFVNGLSFGRSIYF